jgi:hypothetical protein
MRTHYEQVIEEDGEVLERRDVTDEINRLRQRVANLQELLAFVRSVAADLDRKLMERRP